MKKLTIRWQRVVDEAGRTCDRCSNTEGSVEESFTKLNKALSALGIEVELKKERLSQSTFKKDPLQSNRIMICEKPLEDWIGATVGKNQCCAVCGESECRTISTEQNTFETIPENIIIRAGLLAAADLVTN